MKKINFKINSEGLVYVIISAILVIVFLPFFHLIGFLLFLFTLFIIYFFRDPKRVVPSEDMILSPADGIITFIGESDPPKEIGINKRFIKISIFLSIFNVHINRIPTYGKIKNIEYVPGKFFNATLDKSSNENERNIILIEKNNNDLIIVKQIAGLIARRIVCYLKLNETVIQGDKLGIIKFGSRVDLYLPNNYNVLVNLGQTVIGGETIISNPNNIKKLSTSTIK
tara:strand:+ start:1804 stop:2481 length:678 start_codon:yes stop_codon:yes gene_type:complete